MKSLTALNYDLDSTIAGRPLSNSTIKSPEQARLTILREHRADRGIFGNKTLLLIMAVGIILGFWTRWSLITLGCILVVDFIAFVLRRILLLNEFAQGAPRISTAAQATAADEVFARAQINLPSMTDWECAAGLASAPPWKTGLRYRELLRLGQPAAGAVFLDVGCGDGRLGWQYGAAQQVRKYVGLDLGFELVRELTRHLPTSDGIQCGADSLPIKSGALDFIACTEAFEHFAEPGYVLREFARCLGPNGRVVIQSPSALRLRNVNPLHIAQCLAGVWFPWVLLPLVVHEHTFTRTYTYHWDFTLHQFRQYAKDSGLVLGKVLCATYHFNPDGGALDRVAYFVTRHVPPFNLLGWDMTIVLDKTRAAS
jgi:SAM-dependent methyltransferase